MNFTHDVFEPVTFSLEEAKGDVDGKNILAKISGSFFVPDGVSRNKRFYSKELWEKVISNSTVQEKLKDRRMFGTISHEQKLDDSALLDGKVSHIVTNLQIQDNRGLGEALVLDTPAGKILNTILRAGSKLFVSSRANGAFKGEEKGIPKVDPNSYILESFDFVLEPGFVQANPKLVESLNKLIEDETQKLNEEKGENEMDLKQLQDLLQKNMDENAKLRVKLEGALDKVQTLENEGTVLTDENNTLKENAKTFEDNGEVIKAYEELGKADELKTELETLRTLKEGWEKLGTPEKVEEALTTAKERLDKYKPIGEPEKILESLEKAKDLISKYKECGDPEKIHEALDKIKLYVGTIKEKEGKSKVEALAKKLGVTVEQVSVLSKAGMDEEKITEYINGLTEGKSLKNRYAKTTENLNEENSGDDDLDDDDQGTKSLGENLMEYFNQ